MKNSENSALPTTSAGSPEGKPQKPSYWLTKEEIQELHEDARRAGAEIDALMRKRYGDNLMLR